MIIFLTSRLRMVITKLFQLCKFVFLLPVLLHTLPVHAQRHAVDSTLSLLLQHKELDTTKVRLMNQLAYHYHLIDPDSTVQYSRQAYEFAADLHDEQGKADALKHWAIGAYIKSENQEAILKNEEALVIYEKLGDFKGRGAVLNNMAIIYHNQGEFPKALRFYKESLHIREKIHDEKGEAATYNNMGNVYTDMGNFTEALTYLFKGLELREKHNEKHQVANSYANISGVYVLVNKYREALYYGLNALKLHKESGNKDGLMQSYIAIGNVYFKEKQINKAMQYFNAALVIAKKMNNGNMLAVCLTNLGEGYIETGRYQQAASCFKEALALCEPAGDQEGILICELGLGEINLKQNKVKESFPHLLKGYEIASTVGIKLAASEATELLASAYEKSGDYKKANLFLKEHVVYKDSLFNDESRKKIQETEFNFRLDKKQNEITMLEKDKSIQRAEARMHRFINVGLFLLSCLLVSLIIVLYRSRSKEMNANRLILKQKKEIENQAVVLNELNTIKDKIFSVLAHDLRSPVSSLLGIVSLMEQKAMSQEQFLSFQDAFSEQLKSLNLLLDNLLNWSKNHIRGGVETNKKQVNISEKVNQVYHLFKEIARVKNVKLVSDVNPSESLFMDADHLDIVLRNLISNAIKYSKPHGEVKVSVTHTKTETIISVKDHGIGITNDQLLSLLSGVPNQSNPGTSGERGIGIGLLLCKEFTEKNGGKLTVTSQPGKGAEFYITMSDGQ